MVQEVGRGLLYKSSENGELHFTLERYLNDFEAFSYSFSSSLAFYCHFRSFLSKSVNQTE